MRHAVLSLVLGFFLFLAGCETSEPTFSLHPLIPPEANISDPSLQGDWTVSSKDDSEGSMLLRFSWVGPSDLQSSVYFVQLSDNEESEEWLGHLGRIDEELFLDWTSKVKLDGDGIHLLQGIYVDPAFEQKQQIIKLNEQLLLEAQAETGDAAGNGGIRQLRIKASPLHWIFKVELTEKGLRLGYLNDHYISTLIQNQQTNVDCVRDHGLILTAETSQLQELVAHVTHDPEAFTWLEFEKVENQ
jgi:hypothetical protein